MHCIHLKNDDIFFFLTDRFGFWCYKAQFNRPFDFKGKHDVDDEQDVDREAGGIIWERLEDVVSFWFTVHLISDICHFFYAIANWSQEIFYFKVHTFAKKLYRVELCVKILQCVKGSYFAFQLENFTLG